LRQEYERKRELHTERLERKHLPVQASAYLNIDQPQYVQDMNNVGLPSSSQYSSDALSQQFRYVVLFIAINILRFLNFEFSLI
jgi:hypothetical protein